MIKNEEEAICKTLEPFVEAKFPNFFIYDTGSTDGTIKVVTDFLNLHKCNFIIKQEEFISFGVSRNKSLDYSRDLFPNCKFTLSLDCEWYIKNPQGIIDFCSSLQEPLDECYSVWIQSNLFFCQYRLFVNKHNARYFGAVHEVVISHKSKGICVPKTTYFLYSPTGKGNQKTANRWYRDISLLLKEYKDNNKEPRSTFYLAQTYDCLVEVDVAFKYYKERFEMTTGYDEEKFVAGFRAGKLYKDTNWSIALKYFLASYADRPHRIEPLVCIAQHYDSPSLKYMFAKIACQTLPNTDQLFIDHQSYETSRWEQLYLSCYHLQFYKEGYDALLKIKEDTPQLRYNRHLFDQKLGKISTKKNPRILLCISHNYKDEELHECLSSYYEKQNIDFVFYGCHEKKLGLQGRDFYIRGKENSLLTCGHSPGLLERTLSVFEHFAPLMNSKYDYIIRSDSNTCINIRLLKLVLFKDIDYGGPLYFTSSRVNNSTGMTAEKHSLYGSYGFVSGTCTILSSKAINYIVADLEQVLCYQMTDDLAISIFLKSYFTDLIDQETPGNVKINSSTYEDDTLVYHISENGARKIKDFTSSLLNYNKKYLGNFILDS